MEKTEVLNRLGIKELNAGICTGTEWIGSKGIITESVSPIDGTVIGRVQNASQEQYEIVIEKAQHAFTGWR